MISYKKCSYGKYTVKEHNELLSVLAKGKTAIFGIAGRTMLLDVFYFMGLGKDSRVAIPEFYPHGIVLPLRKMGIQIVTYRCNCVFEPNMDDIRNINAKQCVNAIIAIHYFGLKIDFSELNQYCIEQSIHFLEDCAHSIWHYVNQDYQYKSIVLYSFTKIFSISDGAMAVFNIDKEVEVKQSNCSLVALMAGKAAVKANILSLFLRTYSFEHFKSTHMFRLSNGLSTLFYSIYYLIICKLKCNPAMSRKSHSIIDHICYKDVMNIRSGNAIYLAKLLAAHDCCDVFHSNYGILIRCDTDFYNCVLEVFQHAGVKPMMFKKGWFKSEPKSGNFDSILLLPVAEHLCKKDIETIADVLRENYGNA